MASKLKWQIKSANTKVVAEEIAQERSYLQFLKTEFL
jgi:hypothetical protein